MEQLRTYLNSLAPDEQAAFASRCKTSVGYLRKAISSGDVLREKLCALIEKHSGQAVTRRHLRPEDWVEIWPELAVGAVPVSAAAGEGAHA